MKGKLLFVAGLAAGYVLGTRAGRERYEQIKRAADKVWSTPTVQKGVDQVRGFAMARVGDVSDAVLDGAKKLIKSATSQGSDKPAPTSADESRKAAEKAAADAVAAAAAATKAAASAAESAKPVAPAAESATSTASGGSTRSRGRKPASGAKAEEK